jgi:phosphoribosyl-dephospho-CoA transferase
VPPAEPPLQRHRLVRVHAAGWDAFLDSRGDLASEPVLRDWARRGWPLIVRRRLPGDGAGVPLGLPLPPAYGKRRISVELPPEAIASVHPLPDLCTVIATAPVAWRPYLADLATIARDHDVRAGVFGGLGWQWLTGLAYLSPQSDVDIAWALPRRERIDSLLGALAAVDACSPMRLDGEVLRADGAGVNWRELRSGRPEVALKTAIEVALCSRSAFIGAAA